MPQSRFLLLFFAVFLLYSCSDSTLHSSSNALPNDLSSRKSYHSNGKPPLEDPAYVKLFQISQVRQLQPLGENLSIGAQEERTMDVEGKPWFLAMNSTFDTAGNRTSDDYYGSEGIIHHTWAFTYDSLGRLSTEEETAPYYQRPRDHYSYGKNGRLLQIQTVDIEDYPEGSGFAQANGGEHLYSETQGAHTTLMYDDADREIERIVVKRGDTLRHDWLAYNGKGRLVERKTFLSYEQEHWEWRTLRYDDAGRMIGEIVKDKYAADAPWKMDSDDRFYYDSADYLIQQVHIYSFDPESGNAQDSSANYYHYDAAGLYQGRTWHLQDSLHTRMLYDFHPEK